LPRLYPKAKGVWYYSEANLRLLRVIDETYLAYPCFGSRHITRWLRRPPAGTVSLDKLM
jgi:hypothetical protein